MIIIKILQMIFSTIILKILFDYIYINFIYKYFAYETFRLDFDSRSQIISFIVVILTAITLKLLELDNRSMKIPIYIMFFSLLLPLATIYPFESMNTTYFLTIMGSFNLMIVLLILTPDFKILNPSKHLTTIAIFIMLSIYLYTYFMLLLNGGFSRINFNLDEVYETRELLHKSPFPLSGYFISWIGYSFNPLLIIWGLYSKNKKLLFFGLFLQLLLFGMTNYKAFLFSIPLMIAVYYATGLKRHFIKICLSIIILLISLIFIFTFTDNVILSSILIRRQFFVPAHLHFLYHEFFSSNRLVFLSDSIFKYFINYPYSDGVTRIIGIEYWGRKFGPNVGFFGNAYYNFGNLGIVVFSLILCLLTKLIVSMEKNVPKSLITSIILVPFMTLINSGLLTTLLTHSLFVSGISIWLLGSVIEKYNEVEKI